MAVLGGRLGGSSKNRTERVGRNERKVPAAYRGTSLEPVSSSSGSEAGGDDSDSDSDPEAYLLRHGGQDKTEDEQFDALLSAVRRQVEAQLGLEPGDSRSRKDSGTDPGGSPSTKGSREPQGISRALKKTFAAAGNRNGSSNDLEDVKSEGNNFIDEARRLFFGKAVNEDEQIEIYSQRITAAAEPKPTTSSRRRLSSKGESTETDFSRKVAFEQARDARRRDESNEGVLVPLDEDIRRQERRTDLLSPAQRVQAAADPELFAKMEARGDDDSISTDGPEHHGKDGLVKRKVKTGLKKAGGLFKHTESSNQPAKRAENNAVDTTEDLAPTTSTNYPSLASQGHVNEDDSRAHVNDEAKAPPAYSAVTKGAITLLNASTDVLDRLTGNLSDRDEIASQYGEPEASQEGSALSSEKGFQPGAHVKRAAQAKDLIKKGKIEPVTETELVDSKTRKDQAAQHKLREEIEDQERRKVSSARDRSNSASQGSGRDPFIGAYPSWWERWTVATAHGLGLRTSRDPDAASISTLEQEKRAQQMRAFEKMEVEKFTRNFSKHVKEVRTLAFGNERIATSDGQTKPFTKGRLDTLPTRWSAESRMPRAEDFLIRNEEGGKISDRVDWIAFTIAYILCLLENYTRDTLDEEPLQPYRMSTFRSHVERLYIVSPAWENVLYGIRDLYRWKDPRVTARYAMLYFIFWYLNLLPSAFLLWGGYHICRFRYFPPPASALAEHVRKRRDRGIEAMRLSERLRRQTRLEIYELYLQMVDKFGAHGQMLLGDFVDLCEMVKNLILWRRPNASMLTTARFVVLAIAFAIAPADILYQTVTLSFGIWFFTVMPLASHFPRYRRALNPFWWLLWGAPTDAQYCIEILRKEAEVGIRADQNSESSLSGPGTEMDELARLSGFKSGQQHPRSISRQGTKKAEVLGTHFCFHKLLPGFLYVYPDLIKFKALRGMTPKRKLCQLALADVVGIKKGKSINVMNLYASEGLEISLKDGSVISFANMARRDQAFNKLIAVSSKDHMWKKV